MKDMSLISSTMFVIRFDGTPKTALEALPPTTPVLLIDIMPDRWEIKSAAELLNDMKGRMEFGHLDTVVVVTERPDYMHAHRMMMGDNNGYILYPNGKWWYIYPNDQGVDEWDF